MYALCLIFSVTLTFILTFYVAVGLTIETVRSKYIEDFEEFKRFIKVK